MKYKFSKNSNGSWVVFNNKNNLPVGTVSEDGSTFHVAHYSNMTIEHELMSVIIKFMSKLRDKSVRIKEFLIIGSSVDVTVKTLKHKGVE